jgi:hypothetical protein
MIAGNDDSGGIEGLPLQLMITILVATLGTAIILGWMGNIDSPQFIGDVEVSPSAVVLFDGLSEEAVVVWVTDQDGNPLKDAVVTLSGLGVKKEDGSAPFGVTGQDGSVDLGKLRFGKMSGGGKLTVSVSETAHGDKQVSVVVIA